jgi:hypothetical protein
MTIRSRTIKLLATLFAGTAITTQAASIGPDMVHYSVGEPLAATGIVPGATGSVQVVVKQEGNRDRQRVRVQVAQLAPRTSYTLLALIGDASDFVVITNFTTTPKGRGSLLYVQNRVLNRPAPRSAGKRALPEALNSLVRVRALAIANAAGDIVLSANLHESASMNFELASIFKNTGNDFEAIGCIAMACQKGGVQFRLFAAGESSQYTFYVNDASVGSYPADVAGRISVGAFPQRAPSPLLFQKMTVRNAADEIVLESNVP